jgi:FMN phosphatase YigB (HAD superfamily)
VHDWGAPVGPAAPTGGVGASFELPEQAGTKSERESKSVPPAVSNRMSSVYSYQAALFDLFGTLVDGRGNACDGAEQAVAIVRDLRWAVVTSCGRELAEMLLRRAKIPVPQVLVAAEDVARQKPAPDGYLLAAKLLSVEPSACVVFEDSTSGMAAARSAGMRAVSVLPGWRTIDIIVLPEGIGVRERGF